jgi:hypothetical protein
LLPARKMVIETYGSIEQVDGLKVMYYCATAKVMHMAGNPPNAEPVVRLVCGDGLYVHRYRLGSGSTLVRLPSRLMGHIARSAI